MKKVLVTGGEGQVAQALRHSAKQPGLQIFFCNRHELDITCPATIATAFTKYQPDIVINAAAYTAVDKAENEKLLAQASNHQGALNLAHACRKQGIPLLHLSTDYVFAGTHKTPYTEDAETLPCNIYGETKLQGEKAIQASHELHIILRVSGIFSAYQTNFYKTILRLAKEKKMLRIVADQTTCPTYANHIASVLFKIVKTPEHFGVYHYCDADPVSWYEFAKEILKQNNIDTRIEPITTAEYPTAAQRPPYSVLDCKKINRDYAIQQYHWRDAIKQLTLEKV